MLTPIIVGENNCANRVKVNLKMKIVKFKGGLGNQLFQYAFMRALEIKYGATDVKGDFSCYVGLGNDTIRVPRIEKLNVKIDKANIKDLAQICALRHQRNPLSLLYKGFILIESLINSKYYFEKDRSYRNLSKLLKYNYFDGYWQSWMYLEGIEDLLKEEIVLKENYSKKTEYAIKKIQGENAVFLGIRRGDYFTRPKHWGSFDMDYYESAIEYIKEFVDNPIFYIFSNDIGWVRENMVFDCNVVFRDEEDQTSDIEELFIMASCKHAIIANSTFNWWGAWLMDNVNKIVVAPKNWFADNKPIDIVPDTWVKM